MPANQASFSTCAHAIDANDQPANPASPTSAAISLRRSRPPRQASRPGQDDREERQRDNPARQPVRWIARRVPEPPDHADADDQRPDSDRNDGHGPGTGVRPRRDPVPFRLHAEPSRSAAGLGGDVIGYRTRSTGTPDDTASSYAYALPNRRSPRHRRRCRNRARCASPSPWSGHSRRWDAPREWARP